MSQGNARLLLGTSCVGLFVVIASLMLWFDFAQFIFPNVRTGLIKEFLALFALFTIISLMMIPFDILGGLVIPSRFERRPLNKQLWWTKWSRFVLFQVLVYSITFFIYLQIGRTYGVVAVLATVIAMQIVLLVFQFRIWMLLSQGALYKNHSALTAYTTNHDHRFTGGVTGLPGFETILIPLYWKKSLSPESLQILKTRRLLAIQSGARWRGLVVAVVWNAVSLAMAMYLTASVFSSVASMVTLLLWFVLFSFLGLLMLPALNRASVFALDRFTMNNSLKADLQQMFKEIDQFTEQDPSRNIPSESVFQPIPCLERRIAALDGKGSRFSPAWNVARTTLFLSWSFGGPLSRAVHCNVGRPELWAILPTD